MKKENKTRFAILGLLTVKPLTGYDIKKILQDRIAYFWSESNGQLYPTLNQLLNEQLIVLFDSSSSTNKKRNRYAITEQGRIELLRWMHQQDEKYMHRDENLLKLFFGNNISKQACIELLKNRAQKLNESLSEYRSIKDWLQTEFISDHQLFWTLTVNNGISSAQAEIKWCRESIKLLKQSASPENSNKRSSS